MGGEVESIYKPGYNQEDALSNFMGQSDFGVPTEIGVQSMVGG